MKIFVFLFCGACLFSLGFAQQQQIPLFGYLGQWHEGGCSVTCGNGTRIDQRECIYGRIVNFCQGPRARRVKCKQQTCLEKETWGRWESGPCTKSCGGGSKVERRSCSGGQVCSGVNTRMTKCGRQLCPMSLPLNMEELKIRLTPLQYFVTQEKGTERPFTGKYYKTKESGVYSCIACHTSLFSSVHKYETGTGWPSFYDILNKDAVAEVPDRTYGMIRTEVICSKCGSHLGHVFGDGPRPTGRRYCLNSASLIFQNNEK